MKISQKALDAKKISEGNRLDCYSCSAGHLTIGIGHLVTDGKYKLGDRITQQEADRLFKVDCEEVEKAINRNVKVVLTQNQFDALSDFVFQYGETKFRNSTLLKKINENKLNEVPTEFAKWVKATNPKTGQLETLKGLVTRRQRNIELWKSK